MAEQPSTWRPILKQRALVAAGVLAAWTVGIEARLVYLQVVSHDEIVARAERQQQRTTKIPANRGEIYDRHGRLLAYSVDADTVYAVPYEIADAAAAAAALCGALDDCDRREQQALAERLSGDRAFAYVRRRATPPQAGRVAALKLAGVGFMKESRRFYPNRELAAHLLGYVGVDNVGLHGIEAAYDKVILGQPGQVLVQTDARHQAFSRLERPPTSGASLELTIDEHLQFLAERELRAGVERSRARAGTAVIMDPRTGELLAIANWPTFNPNAYNTSAEDARRNRAVQDLYEPGSTFKLVTASAALEERVVSVEEPIDVSAGHIRFGSRVINDMFRYGVLSFTDVMVKSSNVGAIKVGLRLGNERLGLYMRRFGFGRPTSPDFPGESPGIVWDPARLNDSALASVSMGYQVGVTPLQMAAAMSALANGGRWIEPRVVRAVVRGQTRTRVMPNVTREVITPRAAAELLPILEAVVERGTARNARIAGYTVAGKTGTADKLVNGRYSKAEQNVSFVGFLPSRDPVLTILVMIDTPRAVGRTGGAVAAPIFKAIAEASLRHLGIPPTVDAPPPVLVERRASASVTSTLLAMDMAPVTTAPVRSVDDSVVPELLGLGARDALRALARVGLTARVQGAGVVVEQTPAAGTPLDPGTVCTLVLERGPVRLAGAPGAPR